MSTLSKEEQELLTEEEYYHNIKFLIKQEDYEIYCNNKNRKDHIVSASGNCRDLVSFE